MSDAKRMIVILQEEDYDDWLAGQRREELDKVVSCGESSGSRMKGESFWAILPEEGEKGENFWVKTTMWADGCITFPSPQADYYYVWL
jgi:hypothetical protein